MAETLVELVARISADATELKKGLGDAEKDVAGWVQKSSAQFKAVGAALTGIGVGITATIGSAVMAAAEEEAGIIKLQQALKNVGVSYDEVKGSLEGVIAATQLKTAQADDRQRAALAELLAITNDYSTSLSLLPIVLDMAAAKGMDLASAAQVVGRVSEGNTTILSRYGIQLKEGATATEALGMLQAKFAGQAEAYGQSTAGQFANIKNAMSDTMETIGVTVLPILNDLFKNTIIPLITKLREWTEAHPELTKQLVIVGAAVGVLATVIGPILIALPMLIAGFAALTGPVGLVILAIMALVAAGTAIVVNWETIKEKTVEIWNSIVNFFTGVWNTIVGLFWDNWDKILGILFPGVGLPILIARNWGAIVEVTSGIFGRMGEVIKSNFKGAVNAVVDMINSLLDFVATVKINFPGLSIMGKQIIPAFEWGLPPIPHIPRLASGGVVTQPTMAMVGEAGPEAIIPLNQGLGGVTVNFSQPVFFDREDTMNKFVDMIRKGIQRQDRLRFGGAYNGT